MHMKNLLREALLWITIFLMSVLLGATVYQMTVVVPGFSRDIPNGMIELAKGDIQPKNFWTSPIIPAGFISAVLALIFNWKTSRKKWLLIAIILTIVGELFTLVFVFPQLKIMGLIDGIPSADTALLTKTIQHWVVIDQLRFWILIVPAFFFCIKALTLQTITIK